MGGRGGRGERGAVSCDREGECQRWQRTEEVEGRSSISKQQLCISAREGNAHGERVRERWSEGRGREGRDVSLHSSKLRWVSRPLLQPSHGSAPSQHTRSQSGERERERKRELVSDRREREEDGEQEREREGGSHTIVSLVLSAAGRYS